MQPIKVLILEDSEADALLMVEMLKKSGFHPSWTRVETREAFCNELKNAPDLILSDYSLPQFDAEEAFRIFKSLKINAPFIIVSGTMPDEKGVFLMKQGVDDFILKDRMGRLAESIKNALENCALVKEKCLTEMALRKSEEKFRNAFHFSSLGIALVGEGGNFIQINKAFCDILNFQSEELLKKTITQIYSKEDAPRIKEAIQQLINETISEFQLEVRLMNRLENPIWVMFSASLLKSEEQAHFICQIQDITEKKQFEQTLLHFAYYDIITGLPNRRSAERFLEQQLLTTSILNKKVAVFLINIDQLPLIEETSGSFVSDPLTKQIASRLNEKIFQRDFIGSWGNGEFIIIFSDFEEPGPKGLRDSSSFKVSETESHGLPYPVLKNQDSGVSYVPTADLLLNYAQKIQDIFKEPLSVEETLFYVTCSIGIATFPDHTDQNLILLKFADIAMNRAKADGYGSIQIFEPLMYKQLQERLKLQLYLNKGIRKKEFSLYFQPVISLANKNILSTEALMRWSSSELGPLSAEKFIPIAEDSNLICSLGEWALRTSCEIAVDLQSQGCPPIVYSVNISPRQLKNRDFPLIVQKILNDTGFDPFSLRLEITERQLMENLKDVVMIIKELQDMGVQFAIDDFGSSYSCFDYLKHFSVNRLKIDKSFIQEIHKQERSKAIVNAMLAMSQELNIPCIAEGVETREDFQFLNSIGCSECQGFYYSPPVPLQIFSTLLHKNLPNTESN